MEEEHGKTEGKYSQNTDSLLPDPTWDYGSV